MKVKDIIFEYLQDYKYQIKEHTYWIYYLRAKRLEDNLIIENTTPKNYLNEYLLNKKLSSSTKKMLKSLINRSLDYANQSGLLCYPHKITLKIKKEPQRIGVALTKEDQKKLEDYIFAKQSKYHYGIIISLYTGLRIGELLSLRWEDVHLKENYINVKTSTSYINGKVIVDTPKTTSSVRQIPIAKKLKPILMSLKKDGDGYVLKGRTFQKVTTKSYESSFKGLLKKLKLNNYTFHCLRHTFASRLMENKIDVKTISELMGHSESNLTLSTYVHTTKCQKDNAVLSFAA